MGLSSLHLDAFHAAAQALNFSQAAKELHITQSALSQRIKSLEEELGLALFMRMPRGVTLTDSGTRLLRYCHARSSLEVELLADLKGQTDEGLSGELRIGGYSSVLRSVVVPALAPLLRANPKVFTKIECVEMQQLPELLLAGTVDFIVTDRPLSRTDLESVPLGDEEYVMVESRDYPPEHDVFLDLCPEDPFTAQFLAQQDGDETPYRRSFMNDIYAIGDAVACGLGRAIMSRHLVASDARLVQVDGYRPMRITVHLHYLHQPLYTQLQRDVVTALRERCPTLLEARQDGSPPGDRAPGV